MFAYEVMILDMCNCVGWLGTMVLLAGGECVCL